MAFRPSIEPKCFVRLVPNTSILRCATGFQRRSSSLVASSAAILGATVAESNPVPTFTKEPSGKPHSAVSELTQWAVWHHSTHKDSHAWAVESDGVWPHAAKQPHANRQNPARLSQGIIGLCPKVLRLFRWRRP